VINAWFDPLGDVHRRYSFHANVAFQEERLGSDSAASVRFRISLKRCEVVVILPSDRSTLKADPRTLAMTPPRSPISQERTNKRSRAARIGAKFGFTGGRPDLGITASADGGVSAETSQSDVQSIPILSTLHGQSKDRHHCWRVSGEYEGKLLGSLWNAAEEPRFQVIDQRSAENRELDKERGLPPIASVEIRCMREDLVISEISLKDEEEERAARGKSGHKNRLKAAESYIRTELLKEGLSVGDLSDVFSEMTIAEMIVPLHD
jgi:hypothetical protein